MSTVEFIQVLPDNKPPIEAEVTTGSTIVDYPADYPEIIQRINRENKYERRLLERKIKRLRRKLRKTRKLLKAKCCAPASPLPNIPIITVTANPDTTAGTARWMVFENSQTKP